MIATRRNSSILVRRQDRKNRRMSAPAAVKKRMKNSEPLATYRRFAIYGTSVQYFPFSKEAAVFLSKRTHVTPHLVVEGAAEAMDFYKKAFGAEEICRMPGPDGRLMHAAMKIGDSELFLCDAFPEYGGSPGPKALGNSPVTLHLEIPNVDEAWEKATAAGCTVAMPLENMFWGDRYGKVVDPFGHHWSLSSRVEELTVEQMKERGDEAFADPAACG
jgi:PhnB protein